MKRSKGNPIVFIILVVVVIKLSMLAQPVPEPQITPIPEKTVDIVGTTRKPTLTQNIPQAPTPEILVVRPYAVNVHTMPELTAPVTNWFHQGDTVTLEFCEGSWAKIKDSGYVWGGCFQENPCGSERNCK